MAAEKEYEVWLGLSYAAKLAGIRLARLKQLIGSGKLKSYQSQDGGLLVEEEGILRLRAERKVWRKEAAARLDPPKPAWPPPKMEHGTMPALRARLRGQMELMLPAKDGGAPGRRMK